MDDPDLACDDASTDISPHMPSQQLLDLANEVIAGLSLPDDFESDIDKFLTAQKSDDDAEIDSHDALAIARDTSDIDAGPEYADNPDLDDAAAFSAAAQSLMDSIVAKSSTPETAEVSDSDSSHVSNSSHVSMDNVFGTPARSLMDSIVDTAMNASITPQTTEQTSGVNTDDEFGAAANSLVDSIVENATAPETTEQVQPSENNTSEVNVDDKFRTPTKSLIDSIVDNAVDAAVTPQTPEPTQPHLSEVNMDNVFGSSAKRLMDSIIDNSLNLATTETPEQRKSRMTQPDQPDVFGDAAKSLMDSIVKKTMHTVAGLESVEQIQARENSLAKGSEGDRDTVLVDHAQSYFDDDDPSLAAATRTNVDEPSDSNATDEITLVSDAQDLMQYVLARSLEDDFDLSAKSVDEASADAAVADPLTETAGTAGIAANTGAADDPQLSSYVEAFMDDIIDDSLQTLDPDELPDSLSVYAKQTTAIPDNMAPGADYAMSSYATRDELLVTSHAAVPAGETDPRVRETEAEERAETSHEVLPPRMPYLAHQHAEAAKDSQVANETTLLTSSELLVDDIVSASLQDIGLPADPADKAFAGASLSDRAEATGPSGSADDITLASEAQTLMQDILASTLQEETGFAAEPASDAQALMRDVVASTLHEDSGFLAGPADEAYDDGYLSDRSEATEDSDSADGAIGSGALALMQDVLANTFSSDSSESADEPTRRSRAQDLMEDVLANTYPQSKQTIAVPDNMEPGADYATEDSRGTVDELPVASHAADPAGNVETGDETLPPAIPDLRS